METDGCPSRALGLLGLLLRRCRCRGRGAGKFAGDSPVTLPAADSFPVATDARLGGDESQTRFVMDLDRKIDLHVFTLADPYRVVVDIPQVRFQLPPKTGESGRGLIKAFRYRPGDARRLADGVRCHQAGARRQGLRRRRRRRRAGAAGARSRRHRSRQLPAQDRARRKARPRRQPAGECACARAASEFRRSASPRRARSRPWRHRHRHQGAERRGGEGHRARLSPSACAIASRNPANIAC